jgi:hypothetical protein
VKYNPYYRDFRIEDSCFFMSLVKGDKGLLGLPTSHPDNSKAALIGIGLVVIKSALKRG